MRLAGSTLFAALSALPAALAVAGGLPACERCPGIPLERHAFTGATFQQGRPMQFSVPSACANVPYPGAANATETLFYEAFTFHNDGPSACVTIHLKHFPIGLANGCETRIGFAVYQGNYDPSDPAAGFLSSSPHSLRTTIQAVVAANADFSVVAYNLGASEICNVNFRVSGLQCQSACSGPPLVFIGRNDTDEPAFLIGPGGASPVFTRRARGAAYDREGERLLFNDGSELFQWKRGEAVQSLGTMTLNGNPFGPAGLASQLGVLVAVDAPFTQAIYTIDIASLQASALISFGSNFNISGLEFDSLTGDLYGTSDGLADLVRITTDDLQTVAGYLGGETDVDGLSICPPGKAYLVTDDPTPAFFYVYDFNQGAFTETVANPWQTDGGDASGACVEASFVRLFDDGFESD